MLIALLFDLTLIGDVKCHTYHTGKGERLMATAKRVKVDAAQIRATVTQAQKISRFCVAADWQALVTFVTTSPPLVRLPQIIPPATSAPVRAT
ncbi:MAG: hypothetical protein IH604_15995 [Burkholderiales bacterium]|nr:hypothetical protein [Burkholderiales bacterium]